MSIDTKEMAECYALAFPDRPGLSADKGWLTGTWAITPRTSRGGLNILGC